jgi:hemin uptake protein HemP
MPETPTPPPPVPGPDPSDRLRQNMKPQIDFDHIAQGSVEVEIHFRGEVYRLRKTRNGKLILNK